MARPLLPLLAALVAGTVCLLPASATADPLRPHPYFQDAGTLDWRTSLDDASAAARASGRLIFIEYGRKRCGNCKATVETVIPSCRIRTRMAALCVGLAAECDTPDPRVDALFSRWMPKASILPFCAFVTADLRWVDGWAGLIGSEDCLRRVASAEPVCARWRAVAAAAVPPCARGGIPPVVARPPAPPAIPAPTARPRATPAAPPLRIATAPTSKLSPVPTHPQVLPCAPKLSLDAPSGGLGGCGEDGEMECVGGSCRLVRRPAPVPPPEAETEALADAGADGEGARSPTAAPPPSAEPPAGLAIAPTAPRQAPGRIVTDADRAAARDILARAISAAGRGAYGDVIRLHAEAARLPVISEPLMWNDLHGRATAWIRGQTAATLVPTGPRPASAR